MSFDKPSVQKKETEPASRRARNIEAENQRKIVLRQSRALEREERREEFFEYFVTNEMLERFEDDLSDLDVDMDTIRLITSAATGMNFQGIYAALSYPHELRTTFLSRLLLKVYSGALPPEKMLSEMHEIAHKHGFSVGFHLSRFDIQPDQKGRWAVIGKEQDHRDGDLPMAYYSRAFKHLYKRKLANFLYVVRAENTHRVGDDKKWWRASTLSIVQKIPMDKLQKGLHNLDKEMRELAEVEGFVFDEEE